MLYFTPRSLRIAAAASVAVVCSCGSVIADNGGEWLAIFGSYPASRKNEGIDRQMMLNKKGIPAHIFLSDKFKGLTPGLYVVVAGPSGRQAAIDTISEAKLYIVDGYIKKIGAHILQDDDNELGTDDKTADNRQSKTDNTPSKGETLEAIKTIYEHQRVCDYDLGGNDIHMTRAYTNFRFGEGDAKVEFRLVTESCATGVTWETSCSKMSSLTSFNPADVGRFMYSTEGPLSKLLIECKNGAECVSNDAFGGLAQEGAIEFCDSTKRDRVYWALSDLQKFYKPSKRLPY